MRSVSWLTPLLSGAVWRLLSIRISNLVAHHNVRGQDWASLASRIIRSANISIQDAKLISQPRSHRKSNTNKVTVFAVDLTNGSPAYYLQPRDRIRLRTSYEIELGPLKIDEHSSCPPSHSDMRSPSVFVFVTFPSDLDLRIDVGISVRDRTNEWIDDWRQCTGTHLTLICREHHR